MHDKPLFSVVVPAYNSAGSLRSCLEALTALRYPRERFEVIVSDDGSPSSLAPVVIPFADRLRLQMVTSPNSGPGAARNRGAELAQGTYLVFIDCDCIPEREWLAALERRIVSTPGHLISGGITNTLPDNPFSAATQLIVTFAHEYHARQPAGERFFNSSNMAVPADRFRAIGGFDESLQTSEDYELCSRWQQAGYEVTHAPEVLVYHAHDLTFTGFCRQHFRYGRGLLRWRLGMARRAGKSLVAHPAAFYVGLLRFPLTQGRGLRPWVNALLVAVSQAATAGGVASQVLAEGWSALSRPRLGERTRGMAARETRRVE